MQLSVAGLRLIDRTCVRVDGRQIIDSSASRRRARHIKEDVTFHQGRSAAGNSGTMFGCLLVLESLNTRRSPV